MIVIVWYKGTSVTPYPDNIKYPSSFHHANTGYSLYTNLQKCKLLFCFSPIIIYCDDTTQEVNSHFH